MRTILVTGGAGFIGSHVTTKLLERDLEVVCLDAFDDGYDPARKRANVAPFEGRGNWTLVEGDIRDAELVTRVYRRHGVSATIHLAARVGARASVREGRLQEEVNGLGTVNLLEAAHRWGAYTFVQASSAAVYGAEASAPFAESDAAARPASPYAATKRANELACYAYHHLYGLKATCLRLFTVYGPRQRPDMAVHHFTERLARGDAAPCFGDGSTARDYLWVDDAVDGILAALDAEAGFEVVNLGSGRATPLRRLVELVAAELGAPARVDELPLQPGDVPLTHAEVSRAKGLWGWEPKVGLEEGIHRFVEWYRRERG